MSVSTVQICTKTHFCKPSSRSAILKLPCKPGIPSPLVLKIIPTVMFFTKNEIMPGRLVKAVSERTIRCCYSSHSSADEISDFLWSLQFESITPFVFPDKDTPLDSVKAVILNTLEHQNPNTSNDSSTKLRKEKIKFIREANANFIWRKFQQTHQTTNNIVSHYDKKRHYVEGGVFEGKDSETAKTADETNVSTKKRL